MLAALVASSALGYAPMMQPLRAARSCAVSMAVSDMPGISTETGNVVWDPMGLSENMDDANLKLVRAAELKHGRVAMLAVVGWIWTATGTHFEGLISTSKGVSFADLAAAPNPILSAAGVPGAGIWQMIFAIGALEVFWESKYPSYECAGNFGVPAVTNDPAKLKELQTIELKHGRLAMIGIISFACAVSIPGSVPFYPF
jgi:light-harvesting complex I chlorophyll a/b binding protein 1